MLLVNYINALESLVLGSVWEDTTYSDVNCLYPCS